MSGNGSSGAGIKVLKILVVLAVVAAGVGLGIVAVKRGSKAVSPTDTSNSTQSSSATGTQDSTSSAAGASTRPSTSGTVSKTSNNTINSTSKAAGTASGMTDISTTTTKGPRTTSGTQSPTGTSGRDTTAPRPIGTGTGNSSRDLKQENDTGSETTTPLVADPAVAFVPHVWDDNSGALVVGNHRYLTKLGTLEGQTLDRDDQKTVTSLKRTMRTRVDFQLKDIEEEIQTAVKAYHDAVAAGNKEEADNYHHMVTQHLLKDRQAILDTVDPQLDELLLEALPNR